MPFDGRTTVASPTGAQINLYAKQSEGAPRAAILVNHGLAEHALRYDRFAEAMAARRFHVFVHDHRGHGFTTAPDAPPRVFGKDDGGARVIADVGAVHDHIVGENPGLPVIVFGHSMGGLIALNYVLAHSPRIHGAAIWNANFSAGPSGRLALAILAWERFRLGSDVPSRIMPRLTFQDWARKVPDRRTDFDWLSRDAEEVDKYIADPLCGWDASVSMWRDLFGFIFRGADDRNFAAVRRDLPINLVGGEKDPATAGGKAVRDLAERLTRMRFSNLVSTIYPETRHESLNEINRDAITGDFAAWVDSVIGG